MPKKVSTATKVNFGITLIGLGIAACTGLLHSHLPSAWQKARQSP